MNRKLLLTSTFLSIIPAVGVWAKSEGSKAPHLTISGSATFHAAFMSQDVNSVGPGSSGTFGSGFGVNTAGKGQGFAFDVDDSYLDFAAKGKTDGDLEYMMRVNIDAVPGNSDAQNNFSAKKRVRQTYVQLRKYGFTIIGGTSAGVATTMTADASNIMHGDGGFAGGWSTRFNEPAATNNTPTGNMIYGAYLVASSGTANKLTLTTPRVFGVQLGYSFAPNSKHEGNLPPNNSSDPSGASPYSTSANVTIPTSFGSTLTATGGNPVSVNAQSVPTTYTISGPTTAQTLNATITQNTLSSYFDQNVSEFGLDFSESFGDVSVDLAGNLVVAGQTKYSVDPGSGASPYKTSAGWSTGLTLSYKGIDLSGGYFDNRNTGVTIADATNGADGGKVWNVGAAYTYGPFAVALGYLQGQKNLAVYNSNNASSGNAINSNVAITNPKTKAQVYSMTLDYRLAEGLTTYIDANYAKMEDPSAISAGVVGQQTSWASPALGDQPKNKGTVVLIGTRITL